MKLIISVILCGAVATASRIQRSPITTIEKLRGQGGSRIISGEPAEVGQFPWQVANRFRVGSSIGTSFCGGALICDSWVLTAAHCAKDATHFTLYFGSVNQSQTVESGRIELETTEKYVHERYNQFTLINDIALLRLQEKVTFSDQIQPIPLGRDYVGENVNLTVSGWGQVSDASNSLSPALNYVELSTISNVECADVYAALRIRNTTLCCKGRPEHSTCFGDSGGPLVRIGSDGKAEHVGIVSFVHRKGCASGNPSGYIRTAGYRDWIIEKINGTCTLP